MHDPSATAIVSQVLALRRSHSGAPVRDVFDIVMQGQIGQVLELGASAEPSAPFGQLIAEGFDECMSPAEWSAFTGPTAEPGLRAVPADLADLRVVALRRAVRGASGLTDQPYGFICLPQVDVNKPA